MQTQKWILSLSAVAALALIAGCDSGKKAGSEPGQTPEASKAAESTATAVGTAVEAVKPAVESAVTNATAAATTTANDATAKFNSVVDQAKTLLGQNKYTDALNSLQQLSGLKLTPEQDKIVADLKAQIQKAMAAKATTDGANAVGNLLNK